MRKFSVSTRLTALLCIILLFGFLTTNIVNYNVSRDLVRESIIGDSLPLARDNIYSEIQRDLMRPIFVSSLMANDTFLKDWVINGETDLASITRYLFEVKKKYGFFSSFFISDSTRNYYHFNGLLKKISRDAPHDDWYFAFKDKKVEYDLDVDTNEAEQNHLTIFINHQLTDYQGNFLGVVGVGLNFDMVARLLDQYTEKYQRRVYLVDPDGLIQLHTQKKHILQTNIFEQPGIGAIADEITGTTSNPAFFEYEAEGQHILLTSRYIKELDWYLLVEQNQTSAMAAVNATFIKNMLFSLLITLITILITAWVTNYFQKQLETMAIRDKLTGAFNRNGFENRYDQLTAMARRRLFSLSLILIDIDNFKQINDAAGHLYGDSVLRLVSQKAGEVIRENDLLVRWGGDEFILLILGTLSQAKQVATRLSDAIDHAAVSLPAQETTTGHPPVRVSISCGIAQYREADDIDSLVHRADRALYLAKEQGRHTIVSEEELGPG